MVDRPLTLREFNRATLARQLLLGREELTASAAIERLGGLQAQVPNPPYIGLWTRLTAFRRADLTRLLEQREVVRATLLRSTLHLFTARDYLLLRPALQPALTRALRAFFGRQARGLDIDRLVTAARAAVEEAPRTFTELRPLLSAIYPDRYPEALAYAVRTHLPLVQVPPGGVWGSGGSPAHALAESWLGGPLADPDASLQALFQRYLAAFGPATVQDFQAWSGLTGMKGAVERLKPGLRTLRDERGRELLDLPDLPLPPADVAVPARFLPEYDNLLLSHADRTRIIADEHRAGIFLSAGRVRATFLVDGFVRGVWKIERSREGSTLVIEPFAPLSPGERDALSEEGEQLVRFVENEAARFALRFGG